MTTEKWNPGHSTNKGYPYSGIVSRQMFKNRPETYLNEDNKAVVGVDPEKWGDQLTIEDLDQPRTKFEDFLMHRLFDYDQSLKIAEDQIDALLEESPFMPEDFGFKIIHQPETIHDSPIRIYGSKFDESISIYRKMGDVTNPEFDYANWVLVRVADGNTSELDIKLPCHRIAYALFYALGIKIEEEKSEKTVTDAEVIEDKPKFEDLSEGAKNVVRDLPKVYEALKQEPHSPEDKPKKNPGYYTFDVVYTGPKTVEHPEGKTIKLSKVAAKDKNDSLSRAKFMIETEMSYNVDLVKFEELESTLVD